MLNYVTPLLKEDKEKEKIKREPKKKDHIACTCVSWVTYI